MARPRIKANNSKGTLIIVGIVIFLLLALGIPLHNYFDGLLQKSLSGPEYCIEDIDKTNFGVASKGVELKITKEDGDKICFRTKDKDFVEKLYKQIQDRKLEEELAKIEAQENFMKGPLLWIIGMVLFAIIVIIIAITSSRRRNNTYYY